MSLTLTDLRDQIWEAIGRPTNIDPATPTGLTTLNLVVNEAQRQIAAWKDPVSGRRIRFNCLYATLNFCSVVVNTTLTAENNTTFPYSISATDIRSGDADDRYNGWVVEMTSGNAQGEMRVIVDHSFVGGTNTYYVDSAFSSEPAVGDTCKVYKAWSTIYPTEHAWRADGITLPPTAGVHDGVGNLLEILKVKDITDGFNLNQASNKTNFADRSFNVGTPTEWYRYGNRLYMNYCVNSERWWEVEYYRLPTALVNGSDTPDIPETFHWAIVLWGMWWGHTVRREPSNAYAAKMNFNEYLKSRITDIEVGTDRVSNQISFSYQRSD